MAVSDLVASGALIYRAPVGTSAPADTVGAGTAWGGSWTQYAMTSAPLSILHEEERVKFNIQQALASVRQRRSSEALTVETTLAEITLGNWATAAGGTETVSATPAGVGQPGKEEFSFGGDAELSEYAWGFEGEYVDEDGATLPIRLFIFKGIAQIGGALEFAKEAQSGIPFRIEALEDLTKTKGARLYKWSKILEPAS